MARDGATASFHMALPERNTALQQHVKLPPIPTGKSLNNAQQKSTGQTTPTKFELERFIEPVRKKLTAVDAQKVLAIVDELIMKSEVITLLPLLLRDLQAVKSYLEPDAYELLLTHQQLTISFKTTQQTLIEVARNDGEEINVFEILFDAKPLHETSNVSGTSSNWNSDEMLSARTKELALNLIKLKTELEFSIRNLLRHFRMRKPLPTNLVEDLSSRRQREYSYYCQCLHDTRQQVLDRLLMSPGEQQERQLFFGRLEIKEKANKDMIESLEAQLVSATRQRDNEIKENNEVIKSLQHSLRNLEAITEDDIRRAQTESEKQIQNNLKTSDSKKHKLTLELKKFKGKLTTMTSHNREDEQALRKKKWKLEMEVETLLQKYDEEMTEKHEEYEEINAMYEDEKCQLVKLEARFKDLEIEYNAIMDGRRTKRDKEEALVREKALRSHAAITIQSVWRSFCVRKLIRLREKQRKLKGSKRKKSKA